MSSAKQSDLKTPIKPAPGSQSGGAGSAAAAVLGGFDMLETGGSPGTWDLGGITSDLASYTYHNTGSDCDGVMMNR